MILGRIVNSSSGIDDPHFALLASVVKQAARDARGAKDLRRRQDGWRFLWEICPNIAERLLKTEGIKLMEAVAEQLTLKAAEEGIQEWQEKLEKATAALASYEENIGQIALTSGVENATQGITRLQIEVKMAEAGLAAAQHQGHLVRQREMVERIARLRQEAAELDKQADEYAAFAEEWGPKVENANQQIYYLNLKISTIKRQADDFQYRLQQGEFS